MAGAVPLSISARHGSTLQPPQTARLAARQQRFGVAPPPPPAARRCPRERAAAVAPLHAAAKQVFKTFEDMVTASAEPVLVDFFATWCGPCQMQAQILDQVAPEFRGQIKFVKVDTEKYHQVASKYNVGALPTLILFKNGQQVDRVEGVLMPDQLKQRLQYFLGN